MAETRNVRVCILRATHDTSRIPDDACWELFMTGPDSVFQYWKDMSSGLIDFTGSVLQPWVNINVSPFALEARDVTGGKAYDATRGVVGAAIEAFDTYWSC